MSLVKRIKDHLEEHPQAKPEEIAKAIDERVARVLSGLAEIAPKAKPKKRAKE